MRTFANILDAHAQARPDDFFVRFEESAADLTFRAASGVACRWSALLRHHATGIHIVLIADRQLPSAEVMLAGRKTIQRTRNGKLPRQPYRERYLGPAASHV